MKRIWIVLGIVTILLLSACAPAAATPAPEAIDKAAGSALPGVPSQRGSDSLQMENAAPAATAAPAMEQPSAQTSSSNEAPERLIVKNADLSMIVPDSAQAMQQVTEIAKSFDGYVVSSNVYKTSSGEGQTYTNANITIRVPVEKLEDMLVKIRGLVTDPKTDITSENVTGEDVTATVVDLESRLRNYEKVVAKLNQMMDEAQKTEDALNVFNQLVYYQEQIELLQGQIKYYRETAAMSAITLSLTELPPVVPVTIGGWHPAGVARDAIQALVHFLQGLVNFLIWVGLCILPVLLLVFLPLFFIWKSMKRRGWVWKGWRPVKAQTASAEPVETKKVEKK